MQFLIACLVYWQVTLTLTKLGTLKEPRFSRSRLGDAGAEYFAGECYYLGKGAPCNIDKGVRFLEQAGGYDVRALDLLDTWYRSQG